MSKTNAQAEAAFTEMRTAMLLHTPWFASIMLDLLTTKVGKFPHITTAGTDNKTIWYDEDFFLSLSLPERVFLSCHEIMHCVLMHMSRGKNHAASGLFGQPFSYELYNMAADYNINSLLTSPGSAVGTMPKCGLLDPAYTWEMSTESIYEQLLKNGKGGKGKGNKGSQPGTPTPGQSDGSGQDEQREGETLDQHIYSDEQVSEMEVKRAIAQATSIAKSVGKLPGNLERWVDELLNPQVNWRELLRKLIQRAVGRDTSTWATPHRRRLVMQRVYLPSHMGVSTGTVVWVTDTSGSIGQQEYDAAWAEFSDVIQTCVPQTTILMDCDSYVHNVYEVDHSEDLDAYKLPLEGGGGTSFCPPFDKIKEMDINPMVFIYFTDGYGDFPSEPPPYPVIWVMTTDIVPPFGDAVHVNLNEYK